MKRLTLYIGGSKADLSEDGLILMNYQHGDLFNPAAVKNSYSQDITLPGTADNDRIFGHFFRSDKAGGYDASKRMDFAIYSEAGEVIESGYCKLNQVTESGGVHTYTISLFGGLGSFLYGLSARADGSKMTLADLDYGTDLDFDITRTAVQDAWARLTGDDTKDEKWDIINFAPCYNGIPEDFSADKAIADPAAVSQEVPSGYTAKNGYTIINLAGERDEWDVRDFRSYLQRPVISMRKILEAIADPDNNGGWDVTLPEFEYMDTWLTRPLLPSLGTYKQTTGGMSLAFQQYAAGKVVGRFALANTPAGERINAKVKVALSYRVPGASSTLQPWAWHNAASYQPSGWEQQVLFCQAVGYASDNSMVAAGPVKTLCKSTELDPAALAEKVGYTPQMGAEYGAIEAEHGYAPDNGVFVRQRDIALDITGVNIARIDVLVMAVYAYVIPGGYIWSATSNNLPYIRLWDRDGNQYTPTFSSAVAGSGTATGESAETLRSGAHITKEMLLSTSKTPAEYLVSFCKAFGLYIVTDPQERRVQIMKREDFFVNETIDLTNRVDKVFEIQLDPLAYYAKWYELKWESVGGAFEQEYETIEGVQYGIQRVNTGYDFDAEIYDILSGSAFKSCAAIMARSKYWYQLVTPGNIWYPSVFVDSGQTYTLWDGNGDPQDFDVKVRGNAAADPINAAYPGYDTQIRAEFRDGENKTLDGSDVLLFHHGASFQYGAVTDDAPIMDVLNGGPCWILGYGTDTITMPTFTRYHTLIDMETREKSIYLSLDFGYPRQVDMPGVDYSGPTIYRSRWQKFLRDRLDVDNKVMRCRVDLSGLDVGVNLLRKFYWYRNSLWVLNKITNYSLTTFDPAECEFIQVRDIDNYTA